MQRVPLLSWPLGKVLTMFFPDREAEMLSQLSAQRTTVSICMLLAMFAYNFGALQILMRKHSPPADEQSLTCEEQPTFGIYVEQVGALLWTGLAYEYQILTDYQLMGALAGCWLLSYGLIWLIIVLRVRGAATLVIVDDFKDCRRVMVVQFYIFLACLFHMIFLAPGQGEYFFKNVLPLIVWLPCLVLYGLPAMMWPWLVAMLALTTLFILSLPLRQFLSDAHVEHDIIWCMRVPGYHGPPIGVGTYVGGAHLAKWVYLLYRVLKARRWKFDRNAGIGDQVWAKIRLASDGNEKDAWKTHWLFNQVHHTVAIIRIWFSCENAPELWVRVWELTALPSVCLSIYGTWSFTRTHEGLFSNQYLFMIAILVQLFCVILQLYLLTCRVWLIPHASVDQYTVYALVEAVLGAAYLWRKLVAFGDHHTSLWQGRSRR